MDGHLFLFVYANIYGDIKSVSEISIKGGGDLYSNAAATKRVCELLCVCVCVCVTLWLLAVCALLPAAHCTPHYF